MCSGRYSKLFPNQKISYWANSPETARAEIKKHGSGCDILTFWAYDDQSSFRPCMGNDEMLYIVDGRKCGIQDLIDKINAGIEDTEKLHFGFYYWTQTMILNLLLEEHYSIWPSTYPIYSNPDWTLCEETHKGSFPPINSLYAPQKHLSYRCQCSWVIFKSLKNLSQRKGSSFYLMYDRRHTTSILDTKAVN